MYRLIVAARIRRIFARLDAGGSGAMVPSLAPVGDGPFGKEAA